jgi:hypothetical protein
VSCSSEERRNGTRKDDVTVRRALKNTAVIREVEIANFKERGRRQAEKANKKKAWKSKPQRRCMREKHCAATYISPQSCHLQILGGQ